MGLCESAQIKTTHFLHVLVVKPLQLDPENLGRVPPRQEIPHDAEPTRIVGAFFGTQGQGSIRKDGGRERAYTFFWSNSCCIILGNISESVRQKQELSYYLNVYFFKDFNY